MVHLFVVYGYQGADNDPEKLQLTEHLFAAVLAETRMCCGWSTGYSCWRFLMLSPTVIPSLAKGISDGHWVDLEQAFAFGRGVPPSSTCQFQLDEDKGSRRDFILLVPLLWQLLLCVLSCRTAGLLLILLFVRSLRSSWDASVERARIHSPLWPACWLDCPDRSRSSQSSVVRDIWDVYIREVGSRLSPPWLRVFQMANGSNWNVPLPLVVEFLLPLLVNSNLTKIKVLVGTFFWHALLLWLLPLHVMSCQTAGLLLILLFMQSSLSLLGCHF